MDGLALIFNTGGLYLIPRAFYPDLRYDVAHISVEYVLFFSVVIAYLYSTLTPLSKHWRVCCYRPQSRRKISDMIIRAQQQHQQAAATATAVSTTKGGPQPTLSAPHLQRVNTAAIVPAEQVNNYRLKARNGDAGNKRSQLNGKTPRVSCVTHPRVSYCIRPRRNSCVPRIHASGSLWMNSNHA